MINTDYAQYRAWGHRLDEKEPEKEKKEEPLPPVANKRVIKPKWINRKQGKAKL